MRFAREFRVHQEQKAARNIHCLDDESHRDIRQPLHVEDVTDLFAVGMQGAARMEFPDVQPAVHPAAHKRKQRRKDKRKQQRDARAHQQRTVIGQCLEHGLRGAETCHIKRDDHKGRNDVGHHPPRHFDQVRWIVCDDNECRQHCRRQPDRVARKRNTAKDQYIIEGDQKKDRSPVIQSVAQ